MITTTGNNGLVISTGLWANKTDGLTRGRLTDEPRKGQDLHEILQVVYRSGT